LIQLLSSGGAAALDNAVTLDNMNQRRKALSTIHVVHRLISTNIPYKDLLPRVGQLTRNLLKVKKCSIMMYDRQKKELIPTVMLDLEENEVGQKRLKVGEGLPGWVAEQFTPKLYYPHENKICWESTGECYPDDAYLSVPLFDNDIEGVITVSGKQGFFQPTDREILMTFSEQVVLAVKNVRMNEGHRTMTLNVMQTIANLIETQDPQKAGITAETCNWAKRIAVQMGQSDTDVQDINYGALLHDTGMLRTLYSDVPEDEHRLRGPELSMHVVQSLSLPDAVCEIVYHVNEAWNGEGYPGGLKGSQIPLGSRIIAVAKTFVAVRHRYLKRGEDDQSANERAYKLTERMAKRAFDPDVVQSLGKIINPQM
jgi:HD-GYP domain-containing protein (c-di-GMP phosphodiesterase class II)